ncbi:hypothetical protein PC116_g20506 [Phytophthora cactorum]|nr:hypothetical protein PC114_g19588 [Phytophthora cactorum]KAG3167155.1 hypothetical protein PC128_g19550 [Phytophthora cactorum]KAG4231213.1 hypothetical protein PC116_g20506 [Phytophthora cactorum]
MRSALSTTAVLPGKFPTTKTSYYYGYCLGGGLDVD